MAILLDINDDAILIRGDSLLEVKENKRFKFTLKKFNAKEVDSGYQITFKKHEKINKLRDIEHVLEKFGLITEYSQEIKNEYDSYFQEVDNFETFKDDAFNIRNNKFQENPELIDKFRKFTNSLATNLINRKLYDYQTLASFHLAFSQNACNFSVPGAGKTSIVYGAYSYLKSLPEQDPKHVNKILIVGPLSSFAPWENEFEECFGYSASSTRLSGDNGITKSGKVEHLNSSDPNEITLIHFQSLKNLKEDLIYFLKNNKTMLVVDEAHYIKNSTGLWGETIVEIAKEAKSRVALTGTPAPNGYNDIYNLFKFIYPFKYKDILKIHLSQLEQLSRNAVGEVDRMRVLELIDNIKPFFIRIKKNDLNLPDSIDIKVSVKMDSSQRYIYEFIEQKFINDINSTDADIKATLNKAKLIRLRQASTNPAMLLRPIFENLEHGISYEEDPNFGLTRAFSDKIEDFEILNLIKDYQSSKIPNKFTKVKEIVEEEIIKKREKVIIWTIFINNAEKLHDYLLRNNIKSRLLIGSISQEEKEKTIKDFNNPDNDDFSVVIANPFTVAESISLHKGCHNAIYFERDYNAAYYLQSRDRIHRVGLSSDTTTRYFFILSDDSVDEIIDEKIDIKVQRMLEMIDADIPLFDRLDDIDESDIINALLEKYAEKS